MGSTHQSINNILLNKNIYNNNILYHLLLQSAEPTRDDHSAIVDMDEEKNSHNRPTSSLQQTRPRPKSIGNNNISFWLQ